MLLVCQKRGVHLYKVLIVEDDEQLRRMYERLFIMHGYEAKSLASEKQVMQVATTFMPHVILLDVMLPGYEGISLLTSLKKHPKTKDCIVIMLTNVSVETEKEKSFRHGADMYLIKNDYDPMELFLLIHNRVKKFYN